MAVTRGQTRQRRGKKSDVCMEKNYTCQKYVKSHLNPTIISVNSINRDATWSAVYRLFSPNIDINNSRFPFLVVSG